MIFILEKTTTTIYPTKFEENPDYSLKNADQDCMDKQIQLQANNSYSR